jgi:hypothetical protein
MTRAAHWLPLLYLKLSKTENWKTGKTGKTEWTGTPYFIGKLNKLNGQALPTSFSNKTL